MQFYSFKHFSRTCSDIFGDGLYDDLSALI